MSQQLATIQKVLDVRPLVGPDGTPSHSIELANVLGWQCVVKKDSFRSGDTAVFFEIGSVCPITKPPFTFMEKMKGRVKTVRFRGEISQGLALPLSDFKDWALPEVLNEGDEVSEALGVVKWEPAEERNSGGLNSRRRSNFPDWISKTDEIRIQSKIKIIEEFKALDCDVIATLKMDGSSATMAVKDGDFHCCSRNQSTLDTEDNRFWQAARKYDLENKLKTIDNICLQFELCGPSIQKNRLGLKDYELFLFNIFDVNARKYYDYDDMARLANELGLTMAPLIYRGPFKWDTVAEVLEFARGTYAPFNDKFPREGLVWRPAIEKYSQALRGRMSIKSINNDFLEKIGE